MKINMIIPAAGKSTRNPPNKLLMPLGDMTVIEQTISMLTKFPVTITIVTGHQQERLVEVVGKQLVDNIEIVENPDYETGMASSLIAGISSSTVDFDYYGFCLGDKPFIKEATIRLLLENLLSERPKILAPAFEKKIGHPVFFAKSMKFELLSMSGDKGAKSIIEKNLVDLVEVPVSDKGVILDMDIYLDMKSDK